MKIFRGSGKSTIAALYSAWALCRDPDLRFLVLAAESSLAAKLVRNTKRIIEKHPLTAHLRPKTPDQWASDRFTVTRNRELRDPSFLARGISSNITGTRADVIICDDVEVPNTCATAEKRAALRERLEEIGFILTPGGTQLYLGTPHTWNTIYAEGPHLELGEDHAFLHGFERLIIPALDEAGKSAWPERFPEDALRRQERESGPSAFSSQMMLKPVNIMDSRLDPASLVPYDDELEYRQAQRQTTLTLCGRKLVSAACWWDPAFGVGIGDHSVVAVVFTDEQGEYWLHHLAYLKVDKNGKEDEATQQCRQVCDIALRFHLPSVAVEKNGIGGFLPSMLRRELGLRDIPCTVTEGVSRTAKHVRITESLEAVMAARSLHVHKKVYTTPFISEMQDWKPGVKGVRDDGLDAVAGAIALGPVRLQRIYPSKFFKDWRGAPGVAVTDFDV